MPSYFSCPWLALATALLYCFPALANVGEAFGFGSRSAALAGADVAWGFDGYASYANPAGLALPSDKRLILEWGLLYVDPVFTAINNVVTANNYDSDGITNGNVAMDYKPTFGQELGLSYRLFPDWNRFTFGLTTFFPLDQTAYLDTGETFVPEYVLYRARTQRPQLEFGVGMDLGKGFQAGAGFHMSFALTSKATVFIKTAPNKPSTMRFLSSLTPKAAPYIGFLYTPPEDPGRYSLGAVFRLPVTSDNNMVLNTSAQVFGDSLVGFDVNFTAMSALYYDPMAIEIGSSIRHHWGRTFLQLEYQFWSLFQTPAILIQNPSTGTNSGGVVASPGILPYFTYVNIFVPRIGEEFELGKTILRVGYAYRPSIFGDIPTGVGNYLDPPKHMINAGIGWKFQHFLGFETPNHLDIHATFQQLVSQQITKTPNDELGSSSENKIGSPGYDAGGVVLGAGASLTLPF